MHFQTILMRSQHSLNLTTNCRSTLFSVPLSPNTFLKKYTYLYILGVKLLFPEWSYESEVRLPGQYRLLSMYLYS